MVWDPLQGERCSGSGRGPYVGALEAASTVARQPTTSPISKSTLRDETGVIFNLYIYSS